MSNLEQEIEKLQKAHEEKLRALKLEHEIIAQLPEEPRSVHIYKLYGALASAHYGDSFQGYGDREPKYRLRPLAEAIALLRKVGEIVPFFAVEDGCLGLKPDAAITDVERERATEVRGAYEVKIEHAQQEGAKLSAFVRLASGALITVDIHLKNEHSYGGWERTDGNAHYPESWGFRVRPASLGHAQLVTYSSGSHRGPRSGSRQVYLFSHLSDLDELAAKEFVKEHVLVVGVGG